MTCEYRMGGLQDVPELRCLWKQAFGDGDAFLDKFFDTAFSKDRCFVAETAGRVEAMAFTFPSLCRWQEMAYVYAVATDESRRGQGIATGLMAFIRDTLQAQGVKGILLVPGSRELVRFYAKMGYTPCCPQGRVKASAGGPAMPLKPVSPRRYGELRRRLLPPGGVVQEGVSLEFQAAISRLYAGKELLLSATEGEDGTLLAQELLCRDPVAAAPRLLRTLHMETGIFWVPYPKGHPCAMFLPLAGWEGEKPAYFAFAFD